MRIAVEQGMHTDIKSHYLAEHAAERRREVWWTVYVLDRQMSSLLGVPLAFSDEDISAQLPTFAGSPHKAVALSIHVKISQATAVIMKSRYYRTCKKTLSNCMQQQYTGEMVAGTSVSLRASRKL